MCEGKGGILRACFSDLSFFSSVSPAGLWFHVLHNQLSMKIKGRSQLQVIIVRHKTTTFLILVHAHTEMNVVQHVVKELQ